MSYFKRKAKDTLVFEIPGCKCYACGDTGIVTNGDGLLTAMVKGYDVDDSGSVGVGDSVALLQYIFNGGTPPPSPFPISGEDPSPDLLPCL